MNPTALLELNNVLIRYGKIEAVRGASLNVGRAELVSLIGANGAGKTTTLNAIAGLLPLAAGQIHFQGESLAAVPAYQRVRHGLALVPEGRGVFTRLTVQENLQMGAYSRTDKSTLGSEIEQVLSTFPRLKERLTQLAGTLSGGEQQMLAIGRALLTRPKLLLLDEPSMGLAPIFVEKIFSVIRDIVGQGVSVLLVEQNARLALKYAHRAYVMEGGCISLEGSGESLLHNPEVRKAYLGE